jgi:hypothetical protein
MLDVEKSLKILKDHFSTVTPEEFAANLKEFCPELIEEELAYLNSNGLIDSNLNRSINGKTSTIEVDTITEFVSHFLPDLLRGGKMVFRTSESAEIIKSRKAQAIWSRLWPKIEAKEAALEAVIDAVNNPNSEDFQTVLKVQFRKLFDQDEELLKSVSQVWLQDSVDSISMNRSYQES